MQTLQQILDNIKNAVFGFSIFDAIDIVLVAVLIYFVLMILKRNNTIALAKFIYLFFVAGIIVTSSLIKLTMIQILFANFGMLTVITLILVFPQEIRRALWKISSPRFEAAHFNTVYDCTDDELRRGIVEIVRAAQNMAKKNVGALIVIVPTTIDAQIKDSGTELNAKLSCGLIESIFNTKGPLHDGAVLVKGNRILSAGCFLPLSQDINVPKELGTRHRAAIGVSEGRNVTTIICSEQTGVISVARDGQLKRYYDSIMLTDTLEQIFGLKASDGEVSKKRKRLFKK